MNRNYNYRYNKTLKQAARALRESSIPVGPPKVVLEKVLQAGRDAQQSHPRRRIIPAVRRIAAVLVIALVTYAAVIGWIEFNNPNAAFARIIEPLLQSRNVKCHAIFRMTGFPEIETDIFYKDTGKLRLELDTGINYLVDANSANMVGMMPKYKTAMDIDFDPMPQAPVPQLVTNWVFELRRQLEIAQQGGKKKLTYLGLETLDSGEAYKYQVWNPQLVMYIWADKDSQTLQRMEITIEPIIGCSCKIELVDFDFNLMLEDRLFDMRIPEDYVVQKLTLNASEPAEIDLLEGMKTFTDLTGGHYPDELTAMGLNRTAMRYTPHRLIWQFITLKPQTPGMTELLSFLVTQARGLVFAQSLPEACEADYIGQGVTVNDVDAPIFYYRPLESERYRVIYADLTVEEVVAEDLMKLIP